MCYDADLQHKGLQFRIGNCFGVGFDWNDEAFQEAVRNRDERVWEILEWSVNGGGERYNEAAEFEEYHTAYSSYSSVLSHLRDYDSNNDLEAMYENPYLSAKAKKRIEAYYNGSLEELAHQQRQAEKESQKRNKKEAGNVYLILAENGLYKIGKAKNVSSRIQPFSVHFPMKWDLVHSFQSDSYSKAEAKLHEMFVDKRDVGEWFKLSPADVEYITAIKDGQL